MKIPSDQTHNLFAWSNVNVKTRWGYGPQIRLPVPGQRQKYKGELRHLSNLPRTSTRGWIGTMGVYLLIQKDEVIYVGKSINVVKRVTDHYCGDNGMFFDNFCVIEVSNDRDLFPLETAVIKLYRPEFNMDTCARHTSKFTDRDKEMIKKYLPVVLTDPSLVKDYQE